MTKIIEDKSAILLVDDDPEVLAVLMSLLEDSYIVYGAASGEEAIMAFKQHPDIMTVVMDIKMAQMDGIVAARELKSINPDIPIIFHTGYPGNYMESEVETNEKPFDYITKGESVVKLLRSVGNAVENYRLKKENSYLTDFAEENYGLIGNSPSMQKIYQMIKKASASETKVMIRGETGTGKELVARAIHRNSRRKNQRWGVLNCNHKSPDLIEAELFGNTRGAFTGANADRIGLFEYADKGTVFLDEIGDLDITTQAKLLSVLESGEYVKLGDPKIRKSDVRILCATHRNLEQMVEQEKFREDLYFRLRGLVIELPPLKRRQEDIPILINYFKDRLTIAQGERPKLFDRQAIEIMQAYDWPGNVRQLLDAVESILVLTDSDIILAKDIKRYLDDADIDDTPIDMNLNAKMDAAEKALVLEALTASKGNVSLTAQKLGIHRSNLHKKIKKHKISLDNFM